MNTDEMIEKVKQGYTLAEIAALDGSTAPNVHSRLTTRAYAHKYEEAKAEYKRRRASMVQQRLRSGVTRRGLAKEYGVCVETIYNYEVGA